MKRSIKIFFFLVISSLFITTGCQKILEEQPRSQITPAFFSTPGGILGGIAGVYSDMRSLWGTEGFTNITLAGTDEVLAGGSASGSYFWTYNNIPSGDNAIGALWNIAYQDINTLNGVLQFGATAQIPDSTRAQYLAQAKFLRAFYYFYLVQTFGDVPLHLEFITTATTADSRAPIGDVYTQIIKDFTEASTELPATPTAPFLGKPATQAAALYFLAKVYLTKGWSGASGGDDFKNAYTIASALIQNKSKYGLDLWQDYNDANRVGNEYGKETIFVIDREADLKYGERTTGSFASGPKENGTCFFFRPNYPSITANYPAAGGGAVMTRDIPNGRPFIRIRPNSNYVFNVAFTDRANDSRYDNTFQTTWIANTAGVSTPRGPLTVGLDTAIWTPDSATAIAVTSRVPAFKGILVAPPYLTTIFPSMRKYDDPTRASLNDASTRPFIFAKFSDVYLVAAEAYFKAGDNANAATMLNALRQRSAFRPLNTPTQNSDAATALTITATDVTLDFILAERSRELFGECQRWWDLVRTQSLVDRVNRFNPEGAVHIQATNVLRPIPQPQIDLVTSGPKFPQNPGY